jgi:hypothetical protein
MRILAIAVGAALASAALWYLALTLALDVAAWIAILLAALGAALTFFAIARDASRL